MLEYTLKVGSKTYTVKGKDFKEALSALNEKLNLNLTEDQVRINSVIRLS